MYKKIKTKIIDLYNHRLFSQVFFNFLNQFFFYDRSLSYIISLSVVLPIHFSVKEYPKFYHLNWWYLYFIGYFIFGLIRSFQSIISYQLTKWELFHFSQFSGQVLSRGKAFLLLFMLQMELTMKKCLKSWVTSKDVDFLKTVEYPGCYSV